MALFDADPATGQPEWEKYALVASITGLGILGFLILTGFGKNSSGSSSTTAGGSITPTAPNAPLYYPSSSSYTSIAYNTSTTNNNITNSRQSTNGVSGQQLTILEDTLKTQQDLISHLTHDLAGSSAPSPPPTPTPIPIDGPGSGAPYPKPPSPAPAPAPSPAPSPAPRPNLRTYVVQPGNTLTGIAARYGVSLQSLEQQNYQTIVNTANRYGNPVPGGPFNNIFPNETLTIP